MGASFTPRVLAVLRSAGCFFVRNGKGDHQIWYSPLTNAHFTVDSTILSRHTANGVLKQAGLRKQF
ncbi:type II toxin-antitoxin system HicA family toxin [Corticibacter populi]|uniref:Type II toxin-antitoxin system HicA family toxin n=1 Tax=Corticibacter populi TaxID=1550736 RepID=A0A3M6R012_9BURK|nr:type II toxin-antitoxin system HicA family toxin [Corticibacter populi]RMX08219.1 type II toxin-antitoxin system HicA family toxin [Corticibacter populi]RZS35487.1 HicA-like toxin of HicAB toxin-antitoxin system [Corticibacter populi]